MIFPITDIVPLICRYLSLNDIRALMCVDHYTRDVVEPFTHVRTSTCMNRYKILVATYVEMLMFRLHRTVRSYIDISSHIGGVTIQPSTIPTDYTGLLFIYLSNYRCCVYSIGGMSERGVYQRRYSLTYTFDHPVILRIIEFADLMVYHVIHNHAIHTHTP